jgi:hypothetical protein
MPVLSLSKWPAKKNNRTHGVLLRFANDLMDDLRL